MSDSTDTNDTKNGDITKAVELLEDSTEPLQRRVELLEKAVDASDFTMDDVLIAYLNRNTESNILFPSVVEQVTQKIDVIEEQTGDSISIQSLTEDEEIHIASDKPSVVEAGLRVYSQVDKSSTDREKLLREIISDSNRSGIGIKPAEMAQSIKEFKETIKERKENQSDPLSDEARQDIVSSVADEMLTTEESDDTAEEDLDPDDAEPDIDVDVGIDENSIDISGDITTPTPTRAGEDIQLSVDYTATYTGDTEDEPEIEKLIWYVGGVEIGSGEEVTYQFEYPGRYTISIEFQSKNGETGYIKSTVNVEDKTWIQTSIRTTNGGLLTTEETAKFIADVETQNSPVSDVTWKVNGLEEETGEQFEKKFTSQGSYEIELIAENENDDEDTDTTTLEVTDPTGVEIVSQTDSTGYVGQEHEVAFNVSLENAYIETMECRIDGKGVDVQEIPNQTIHHTFDKPGEHTIHCRVENDVGDVAETSENIMVYVPAAVEINNDTTEVIKGDTVEFSADFDKRLDWEWSFDNASIQRVGETASVEFDSVNPPEARVSIAVENENGESERDTQDLTVHKPEIHATISGDFEAVEGDVVTLSTENSTIEHTGTDKIVWKVDDEREIGTGEQITHRFNEPGTYDVTARIEGTRDAVDTGREQIQVDEYTDTTAVIVVNGKHTTRDEITLDGSNSVAENTEIETYHWSVEGHGTVEGETVPIRIKEPGTYTVSLKTICPTGDTDTTEKEIEIEQYTNITAGITGPIKTTLGSGVEFTADDTTVENLTIESYNWEVNDTPISDNPKFVHTFTEKGRHDVTLTVTAENRETSTDTHSVTVNEPEQSVSAKITTATNEPTLNERVTFSAADSTASYTRITGYKWKLDGTPIDKDSEEITVNFDNYGKHSITLNVFTDAGINDTDSAYVTVLPDPENPPYPRLRPETTPQQIKEFAANITTNTRLPNKNKGQYITQLVRESQSYDIDIEITDVIDYIQENGFIELEKLTLDLEDHQIESIFTETQAALLLQETHAETEQNPVDETEDKQTTDGKIEETPQEDEQTTATDDIESENNETTSQWDVPSDQDTKSKGSESENTDKSEVKEIEAKQTTDTAGNEPEHDNEDGHTVTEDQTTPGESENRQKDSNSADEPMGAWTTEAQPKSGSVNEIYGNETEDTEQDRSDTQPQAEAENNPQSTETEQEDTQEVDEETVGGKWETEREINSTANNTTEDQSKTEDAKADTGTQSSTDEETETKSQETDDEREEFPEERFDPDHTVSSSELEGNEDWHKHTKEADRPEQSTGSNSPFSMPDYAQDLVDIEYVLDGSDDDLAPDNVNSAGVIVTQDDRYIAIAEVTGRDWAIHPPQKKYDIIKSFESEFLSQIDTHTQIVSLPTQFDLQAHLNHIEKVTENSTQKQETLVSIGRSIYPNWIEDFMQRNDMKQRTFYIIVEMSAQELLRFRETKDSLAESMAELPAIGGLFSRFTKDAQEEITEFQCLRELNTRMSRIEGGLRRLDVKVDRLSDRNEVLSVLYHYYNRTEVENRVFPTKPFGQTDRQSMIGGVPVSQLQNMNDGMYEE